MGDWALIGPAYKYRKSTSMVCRRDFIGIGFSGQSTAEPELRQNLFADLNKCEIRE